MQCLTHKCFALELKIEALPRLSGKINDELISKSTAEALGSMYIQCFIDALKLSVSRDVERKFLKQIEGN